MTRAIWTSIIGLLILAVSSCSFPEQYELVVDEGTLVADVKPGRPIKVH